jgi:hypothetical protein
MQCQLMIDYRDCLAVMTTIVLKYVLPSVIIPANFKYLQ